MTKSSLVCAAVAATILAAATADAKKPGNSPSVPGIDLAAGSFSVKAKSKKGVMSVNNFSLSVLNVGDTDAKNSRIEFWLSADDVLTTTSDPMTSTVADQIIHTQSLGTVKAGSAKKRTVGGGLLKQLNAASGQYIIAVIDADDSVAEVDEFNNVAVSSPLP